MRKFDELIVVGSLRLDKGESLEYAYAAIDRATARNPSYYTFDIIYKAPEDAYIAQTYIGLIKKRITEKLPNATTWFGITNDFFTRPGFIKLIETGVITKEDTVNYMDINPDREKNWS